MKGNKGGGLEKQKARWAWLFIAPWIVGITVFFAVPMAQSVIYSFCNLNVSGNGFKTDFTGLSNYSYLFTKDTFFLQYLTASVRRSFRAWLCNGVQPAYSRGFKGKVYRQKSCKNRIFLSCYNRLGRNNQYITG